MQQGSWKSSRVYGLEKSKETAGWEAGLLSWVSKKNMIFLMSQLNFPHTGHQVYNLLNKKKFSYILSQIGKISLLKPEVFMIYTIIYFCSPGFLFCFFLHQQKSAFNVLNYLEANKLIWGAK